MVSEYQSGRDVKEDYPVGAFACGWQASTVVIAHDDSADFD
ncbi:hypothetical protein [Nitrosomonas aestuarii]|nr:hypothetical protein [Nitrosomonas aestuarii]